ncbi:MAG: TatD family hydrolase [Bacteroidetes bacterium]|nr:TatD family hydrolase [Bacteroidota bacterium]
MYFIDTHAHLYAEEFNTDRIAMVQRAIDAKVLKMILPNVDSESIAGLKQLLIDFPNHCFGMMGLHPCSVSSNFQEELAPIQAELFANTALYKAVGEIGIDLYWDKTTQNFQESAFIKQCLWALELNLPIAIHTRSAKYETIKQLKTLPKQPGGVFHCFSGSLEEAQEIINLGYFIGIGGVLTYKNANLPTLLSQLSIDNIILETDAPYLPPLPFRGKRNESSYIPLIAEKLADAFNVSIQTIAEATSANAEKLFKL